MRVWGRPRRWVGLVVFVAVLAWVAIMAAKVARLSNEVEELVELTRSRERNAA